MKQFDTQIIDQLIYQSKSNKAIFLIGENGTGKSRILSSLAYELIKLKSPKILAISNSPFTRFPSDRQIRKATYHRHLSGMINNKPSDIIKKMFFNDEYINNRSITYGLIKNLDYLGISPEIGISIDARYNLGEAINHNTYHIGNVNRNNKEYIEYINGNIRSTLSNLYFNQNVNVRAAEHYLNESIRDSHKIQWFDISKIISDHRFEGIRALLSLENKLSNRLKLNIYARKKIG